MVDKEVQSNDVPIKLTSMYEFAEKELSILKECYIGQEHEKENIDCLNKIKEHVLKAIKYLDNIDADYRLLFIDMFDNLVRYNPLAPLTGKEDEWLEVRHTNLVTYQQNKRCARVFRLDCDNNKAELIDGIYFSDDGGDSWFTCRESKVPIQFPFDVSHYVIKKYILHHKVDDVDIKTQLKNKEYDIV